MVASFACPSCGDTVPPGRLSCPHCGTVLAAVARRVEPLAAPAYAPPVADWDVGADEPEVAEELAEAAAAAAEADAAAAPAALPFEAGPEPDADEPAAPAALPFEAGPEPDADEPAAPIEPAAGDPWSARLAQVAAESARPIPDVLRPAGEPLRRSIWSDAANDDRPLAVDDPEAGDGPAFDADASGARSPWPVTPGAWVPPQAAAADEPEAPVAPAAAAAAAAVPVNARPADPRAAILPAGGAGAAAVPAEPPPASILPRAWDPAAAAAGDGVRSAAISPRLPRIAVPRIDRTKVEEAADVVLLGGATAAVVSFLLPWSDVVIGSRNRGAYFDTWGLAGPGHLVVFVLAVGVLALAVLDNPIGRWLRTGVFGVALGSLVLGLLWPYVVGPLGAGPGALLGFVGAVLLLVAGLVNLVALRHAALPPDV